MAYVDRARPDDDVVDVWDDEIPGIVLDRLGQPRSAMITLRACFPRGIPNRMFCFDNDRRFSGVHAFRRTTHPTGVSYVYQGPSASRREVEAVFGAFSNPEYTITKDRETGPRAYTAWHKRTVRGGDFQKRHASRKI
jgi:hypothetical protein